jgi:hypothetical protein
MILILMIIITTIMISHIDDVVKWAALNLDVSEVILWSRGMSTAAAVEYTTSPVSHGIHKNVIKFLVLDSPYISVKKVIDSVVQKYHGKITFALAVPLIYACSWMFGREMKSRLGTDIYSVKPIEFASKNRTPCMILSARNDDYIPTSHADVFVEKWLGPCFLKRIDGGHTSIRSRESVLSVVKYLMRFIGFSVIEIPSVKRRESGRHEVNELTPNKNTIMVSQIFGERKDS